MEERKGGRAEGDSNVERMLSAVQFLHSSYLQIYKDSAPTNVDPTHFTAHRFVSVLLSVSL